MPMPLQSITAFTKPYFKTYLKDEVGLSNDCIKHLKDDENIDELDKMVKLTDFADWTNISKHASSEGVRIPVTEQKTLWHVSLAASYYKSLGYPYTEENMEMDLVNEIAEVHKDWIDNVESCKDQNLTKLRHENGLCRWIELYLPELNSMIGPRKVPIAYLVRDIQRPAVLPPLIDGKPYCELYDSVEKMVIYLFDENHPLQSLDNKFLYTKLFKSWSGTGVVDSISSFIKASKDGKSLFAHGVRQNAGADSWKDMKDKAEDRLKALTFSGEGLLTFKNFSDDIR